MKVATIIGARPQFIKAAVVARAFREHRPDVTEILIHTGQHFDANMSDVFFDELDIPHSDYNLGIGGGTHGQNTGRMIEAIEGITGDQVRQVGDVMYDAALYYGERAEQRSRILDALGLAAKSYILATLHRAENTDDPEGMRNILAGFTESPQPIIWPLHPRTRKRLADFGLTLPDSVRAIDPVGYLDMVMLEKHAALIATDSGGVGKSWLTPFKSAQGEGS